MKRIIFNSILLFVLLLGVSSAKAQMTIDIESGLVSTGYNDVRIPGDEGTLFSLKDDLKPENEFFYRLRLEYTFAENHSLSLLYAPLEIRSEGSIKEDLNFEGVVFPENSLLEGKYKFNSYRLTYRYDFVKSSDLEFGLGFTAKIRDARIALRSSTLDSEKTNVGFVPIINFRLLWNLNEKIGLLLYGDALAAPQGRAEDVLLALNYKISDTFSIRAGYRILEGGAENDEVYNFALIHYAAAGFSITL